MGYALEANGEFHDPLEDNGLDCDKSWQCPATWHDMRCASQQVFFAPYWANR